MASITNACRGTLLLLPIDGDVFALCGGKGFHELGWPDDRVYLRRSVDEKGNWLWLPCDPDQASEANEKRNERIGKQNGKGNSAKFIPYDRILRLFKATEKLPPEKVIELTKKHLERGENWAKAAMKEMVFERHLVKSIVKHPRGQPVVLYHLPTLLEPAPDDGRPIYQSESE